MNGVINNPPVSTITYKAGELILKQGDYGTVIYRIVDGQVRLFTEHHKREVTVASLGPGAIFGEEIAFNRTMDPHPMSARAVKDTEVEIWHAATVSQTMAGMSPFLTLAMSQSLRRLVRTRKLIDQQSRVEKPKTTVYTGQARQDWSAQQRRHYRKSVDILCKYRPAGGPAPNRFTGRIKDISQEGARLEVSAKALLEYPHPVGDKLQMQATLPNGKDLAFVAQIVGAIPADDSGTRYFGLHITDISYENQKNLGFFLMP